MNEFDLILEECVDLIASGESCLEECLFSYPEYAAQLEPILSTVACLQEEGREILPPLSLRARIRDELKQAIKSDPPPKSRSDLCDEQDDGDLARSIRTVLKSQHDSLHKAGLSLPGLDNYFSGAASQPTP